MPTPDCDRFDDYLLGELPPAEAACFEAHLAGCADCRDELDRQRQLDRLLAEMAARPDPVPAALIRRIETHCVRTRRRRAARWACGLAATLAAVSVLAWLAGRDGGPPGLERSVVQESGEQPERPSPTPTPTRPGPPQIEAAPRQVATVTFDDDAPAIVIPVETELPNVSIFLVYPTAAAATTPQESGTRWHPPIPDRRIDDELAEQFDDPFDIGSLRGDGPDRRLAAAGPGERGGG